MIRNRMARGLAAGVVAAGVSGAAARAETVKSPNIVLILTDDQGWSQISELIDPRTPESKSDYLETPNIGRIAREGMRFTSGYAPAPLCTPTRRSILCGTSAPRSGTEFPSETGWVPRERITIPKALKSANPNYRCAHFGKWGGRHMMSAPDECGYDADSGVTDNPEGGMPSSFGFQSHEDTPPHFIDNEDPKRSFSVSDDSVAFIREQVSANHPFYVQASYYAPHLSVVCKEETLNKYVGKGTPDRGYSQAFAAMLDDMDAGIGRILSSLDELGVADSTFVFFMSDNGGRGDMPGGDTDRLPTNHPLSGSKQSLLEGGIRVPFMVRGPGIRAGSACRTPVCGYDLLPTFFDLAGGRSELPDYVDGGSFKPLLFDPDKGSVDRPRQGLFFHRPQRLVSAVRQGDYKLIANWSSLGSVVSRELYRVDPDPREDGRNLAGEDPKRADELQTLLLDYLESIEAYSPPPPARTGTTAGAKVIYANDFSGFKSGDPGRSASVDPGLGSSTVQAELDGAGCLVSTGTIPGSGLRVQLSPTPLTAASIKLTVAMRSISRGRWIGVGLQGEDVQKFNDPAANSGPWLMITDRSVRIRGGAATAGSSELYSNTHAPGGALVLELTYYTGSRTVDLSINGMVAGANLPLIHEFPEGTIADPAIRYLQLQLWNDADDTAAIDRVVVETMENPGR